MFRLIAAALVAATLAGCVGQPDSGSRHHGKPPQDPADYHGVPTDMTPPSMLEEPASAPAPASN